tara:strand:+ start:397 stop:996 length:600 start_codon:yes stop_codon:yes gene_type:complete
MNLGKLNQTVILIDTDYLNEKIKENVVFYKDLYPDKQFDTIMLFKLLYSFMLNARVQESGNNVDVLFAYRLENSNLYFCNPNDIWDLGMTEEFSMKTNLGNLIVRSFFADPEGESCSMHFINMFKMLCYDDSVDRIIMVADNAELNIELLKGSYKLWENKSLFLLKDYQNSKISAPIKIKYVNISYAIASALGLENHEF